jgi:hypothetical protein
VLKLFPEAINERNFVLQLLHSAFTAGFIDGNEGFVQVSKRPFQMQPSRLGNPMPMQPHLQRLLSEPKQVQQRLLLFRRQFWNGNTHSYGAGSSGCSGEAENSI